MKKIIVYVCCIVLASCSYSKDKLIIEKIANDDFVCYSTYLLSKHSNKFFECSAGGEFGLFSNKSSPLVRESIASTMYENSKDNILYIVFYRKSDQDFVYKNTQKVIGNKNFKCYKFSKEELEKNNWIVQYR